MDATTVPPEIPVDERRRLDRELADGRTPDHAEDRILRARQLADPETARSLARSLREVVAGAERPQPAGLTSVVPVRREAVLSWREGLLGLAERLQRQAPVNPCGVARALIFLTDGVGPLYNPAPECSIGEMVWWIADGLQLCPPHAWGCPMVMKLDPEHVAWTCTRCGTVAATDDFAAKPA